MGPLMGWFFYIYTFYFIFFIIEIDGYAFIHLFVCCSPSLSVNLFITTLSCTLPFEYEYMCIHIVLVRWPILINIYTNFPHSFCYFFLYFFSFLRPKGGKKFYKYKEVVILISPDPAWWKGENNFFFFIILVVLVCQMKCAGWKC